MLRRSTPKMLAFIGLTALAGCAADRVRVIHPTAAFSTQPPQVNQVEDAAFWIHPSDPQKSMLLVTNQWRGIEQHGCDGMLLRTPPPPDAGNDFRGIDVLYGFPLTGGPADLVFVGCNTAGNMGETSGVRVWKVDPAARKCRPLMNGEPLRVLDGQRPLGVWTARDRKNGRSYLFVTIKHGRIEQYEIKPTADDGVSLTLVRTLVYDKVKAGVADNAHGVFYFAGEEVGVFACPIDPATGADAATQIIRMGEHGLTPDVGGLAIYEIPDGDGYLIAVSQGERDSVSRFFVYNLTGSHDYIATLVPMGDDATYNSSGIAATSRPFGCTFPGGALALKNRLNPNASEDFKLYDWRSIQQQLDAQR